MSLMIEVRIICDKIAKTKARLLKDLKVGDILKINHIFDITTSSRKASFTVTNERTGESEVYWS